MHSFELLKFIISVEWFVFTYPWYKTPSYITVYSQAVSVHEYHVIVLTSRHAFFANITINQAITVY